MEYKCKKLSVCTYWCFIDSVGSEKKKLSELHSYIYISHVVII